MDANADADANADVDADSDTNADTDANADANAWASSIPLTSTSLRRGKNDNRHKYNSYHIIDFILIE